MSLYLDALPPVAAVRWCLCLGVMNNSHYRVVVDYQSPASIRFIHPVQPGQLSDNGWLRARRSSESKEHLGGFATDSFVGQRFISRDEVAKHCTRDDCWLIIDGRVYDFSSYLADHPGGDWAIACHAGRNASAVFHSVHHDDVNRQKENFLIGAVEPPRPPKLLEPSTQRDHAISVFQWRRARLKRRVEVSEDVRLLTFDFPSAEGHNKALLPIGQHLLIGASVAGRQFVVRPYGSVRPLTAEEDDGTLDVLLKVYFPQGKKPGGALSCHLDSLKVGDEVRVKGPTGPLLWEGKGRVNYQGRSFHVDHVNLVCGGTGIVPAYQLIRSILGERDDSVRGVALLYSNKTPADILLRRELDELAERHQSRFHLFYTVDQVDPHPLQEQRDQRKGKGKAKVKGQAPHSGEEGKRHARSQQRPHSGAEPRPLKAEGGDGAAWPFHVGRVDEALVRAHLFPAYPHTVCFVCGPPPMMELAVYPALDQFGFNRDSQVLDF